MTATNDASAFTALAGVSTATVHHDPVEERPAQRLDAGHLSPGPRAIPVARPGVHGAVHPGTRGPGNAGIVGSPRSTRAAIEEMPEGCIAVVDANGIDAGFFGDSCAPGSAAGRRGAGHRRRGPRPCRRAEDRIPGLGQGRQRALVAGLTFVTGRSRSVAAGWRCSPTIHRHRADGAVVVPAALLDEVVRWPSSRSASKAG